MVNTPTFGTKHIKQFTNYNQSDKTVTDFKLSDNSDYIGYYIKQELLHYIDYQYENINYDFVSTIKNDIINNRLIPPSEIETYPMNEQTDGINIDIKIDTSNISYVKYENPPQIYYNITYVINNSWGFSDYDSDDQVISYTSAALRSSHTSGFNIIISASDENSSDYRILENSLRYIENINNSSFYNLDNSNQNNILNESNQPIGYYDTKSYTIKYNIGKTVYYKTAKSNQDPDTNFDKPFFNLVFELPYCSYDNNVPLTHPSNLRNPQGQYSHLQHMHRHNNTGFIIGITIGIGLPLLFIIYLIVSKKK